LFRGLATLADVYCSRCGHQNPDDAHFCSNCGQSLASTPPSGGAEPVGSGETTKVIPKVGAEDTGEVPEPIDDGSSGHTGAVEALPSGSALLVVKRGPNAGSRFLLDQDVTTAGRHPDSDIFLDDVTVSTLHDELLPDGNGNTQHDVGSLNGTYVNREPIDSASLSGGDEVQIGKFRLTYLTASRPDDTAEG